MSFDEKCYELAKYFLPKGSHEELSILADDIQAAVEEWIEVFGERK